MKYCSNEYCSNSTGPITHWIWRLTWRYYDTSPVTIEVVEGPAPYWKIFTHMRHKFIVDVIAVFKALSAWYKQHHI